MWPKAVHFSQDDILLILVEITVQCHPIIYESKMYEVQKSIPEFFLLMHSFIWQILLEYLLYTDTELVLGPMRLEGTLGIFWSTFPKYDPLDHSNKEPPGLSLKVFCDGEFTTLQGSLLPLQNGDCWKDFYEKPKSAFL